MYQDALHHKKMVLSGTPKLLFIASEHFFYLILHGFQKRGVFGPPEPENLLKINMALASLECEGKSDRQTVCSSRKKFEAAYQRHREH